APEHAHDATLGAFVTEPGRNLHMIAVHGRAAIARGHENVLFPVIPLDEAITGRVHANAPEHGRLRCVHVLPALQRGRQGGQAIAATVYASELAVFGQLLEPEPERVTLSALHTKLRGNIAQAQTFSARLAEHL